MSIYTTVEQFAANTDPGHYDTWYGTEVLSAPGYNADTSVVIDGTYDLSGLGAGDVDIVEAAVHGGPLEPAWPYGDYGYHVHLRQAPGGAAFALQVTLQYVA